MNEKIYLKTSLDFISHEGSQGCVAIINRAFPNNGDNTNSIRVYYTVTGTGANEASIVNGSALIPANKNYVEVPINPINKPSTPKPDRSLTITITPNANYRKAVDVGKDQSIVTIAVKDKMAIKAFSTAYGGGSYSKGGRGGNVYHVTNLRNSGVGSFRWALQQPKPATILFDVSGIVNLTQDLEEYVNDTTIAGQSAPAGGIAITTTGKNKFYAQSNFIMRYVRFRDQITDSGLGLISASNGRNFIIDHCSFSWGGNSSIGTRSIFTENGTLQRNIFAESKIGALYGDSQQHERAYNLSTHNNLWYNISHRLPNIGSNGRTDNINNVIQNWKFRMSFINGDQRYNNINNYYAAGGRTSLYVGRQKNVNTAISRNTVYRAPDKYEDTPYDYEIYSSGSVVNKGLHPVGSNDKPLWIEFDAGVQDSPINPSVFVSTPHKLLGAPLPIVSATEYYNEIVNNPNVGANATLNADGSVNRESDYIDNEYLAVMAGGEGSYEPYTTFVDTANRSYYTEPRYLRFVRELTTTPINTRPSNFYGSNPHIPSVWFNANVPSGKDHNSIAPDGRTYLENYLNQVDVLEEDPGPQISIPVITRTDSNPTTIIKGGNYIPPTGVWTDEIDGSGIATIGGDTVNVNILGNYTVTLYHTNSSNKTARISIIYKIIAPIDPEPGDNINYPLTNAERKRGKQAIIQMIKQKTI